MTGNIVGTVIGLGLMFGVPVAAGGFYLWKRDGSIWIFLVGVLSFSVSQLLLRLPLLQYAGTNWDWFMLLPYKNRVLYYGILGLTAGLFEETARLLAFELVKRKKKFLDWRDGLALGLGHGGVEAVWIAVTGLMAAGSSVFSSGSGLFFGGVERLFAMTLHLGFSFLIEKEVMENRMRWWVLAVVLHGLVDFQLVIRNMVIVECLLAVEAVAVWVLLLSYIRKKVAAEI